MAFLKNVTAPDFISVNRIGLSVDKNPLMSFQQEKPRILIFIGSLRSGGKERRLIEMLTYFKSKDLFDFLLVVTKDDVHYQSFFKLDIPYVILDKKEGRKDPTVIFQFYKVCKKFRPQIVHTWGRMQTFYALPYIFFNKVSLINSQITSAPPQIKKWSFNNFVDRINFFFSKTILSNSQAGIDSYRPPADKVKIIYNGINMDRFVNLPSKEATRAKYNISTPFLVMMAASFTSNKDYHLFCRVASKVTATRSDVTFIGVGGFGDNDLLYKEIVGLGNNNKRILFPGKISDVEALINVCTIGVLFSNTKVHGEGISNSIMEYMSLGKPVIANDAGGTNEIVFDNENGYLVLEQSDDEIASLVISLIDDEEKRNRFGKKSKATVDERFSLSEMGIAFGQLYNDVLNG